MADIDRLPAFGDAVAFGNFACVSRARAGFEFVRLQRIEREEKPDAFLLRVLEQLAREIELVRLDLARADRDPLRFPERVRHRTADENGVGFFHERFDDANFIRDFRAAHDDDERPGRILEFSAEKLQLLLHQEPHRRLLDEFRNAGGAGMGAMGCAESVVHINIAEPGERFRELWIVRFFPRLKTDILEERDVALLHVLNDFLGNGADCVVTKRDRMIDQCVQMIRHRPERILLNRLSFRPPKVRQENGFRAVLAQIINRRQTLADAGVVCDVNMIAVLLDRNVKIDAHQHAFAAEIEITKGQFVHITSCSSPVP